MDDEFNSTVSLGFFEWKKKFEMSFVPEYLYQIDDNTFVYDMDTLISDTKEYINETNINDVPIPFIEKLPKGLISTSLEEQKNTKNLAVFHFMCDGYIQRNKKVVQYKCLR